VEHILWFDQHDPANEPVLGGKNASLGILTLAGLPVPRGFAVSADAYRKAFADGGLDDGIAALMTDLDPSDSAQVAETGRAVRELVLTLDQPAWLRDQLDAAYADLAQRCGTDDVPVAVRSSATCEDQPDASFAGEHDTYLWVRGADNVAEHLQRCWSSLYTDRAICYRRQMNYAEDGVAMSVGVQQMVMPRASGVAFTLNPLNGDRSQVAIDASWGLGEAVVSGSVTPDNFLVDKVMGEITRRTISSKSVEHVLGDNDRVVEVEVDAERRDAPCLTDDEVRAVAKLARRAEKHYGCPQDVEWAIAGDEIVLLQSRPETVWSRKKNAVNGVSSDTYASIVHNLLNPQSAPTTSFC
jgi:pyruvate,water dikinase